MLSAIVASLLLIVVSELGDKSFFIAAILAMRHSRRLVYAGVLAALAVMTILSVVMGKAASLLPRTYIYYAEVILFIGFGIKMLMEAIRMPANSCDAEVVQEAKAAVTQAESKLSKHKDYLAVALEAFWLTSMVEWGDLSQIGTIALSASYNPIGVALGAIFGHGICTGIAVIGGRMLAGRISERKITLAGGLIFLLFGVLILVKGN